MEAPDRRNRTDTAQAHPWAGSAARGKTRVGAPPEGRVCFQEGSQCVCVKPSVVGGDGGDLQVAGSEDCMRQVVGRGLHCNGITWARQHSACQVQPMRYT